MCPSPASRCHASPRKVLDAAVAKSHGDNGMLVALGDWNFPDMFDLAVALNRRPWIIFAPGPIYRDVIFAYDRPGTQPP